LFRGGILEAMQAAALIKSASFSARNELVNATVMVRDTKRYYAKPYGARFYNSSAEALI
jgi:hypothetical protein